MKERPILFSTPMVRALLDGSKTQTRRIIKPHPRDDAFALLDHGDGWWPYRSEDGESANVDNMEYPFSCPYGQPGDRLYVRETWAQPAALDPGPTVYRADYPACVPAEFKNLPTVDEITWKPSIHMPRALSRILLEVVSVRVEQLNNCSDADAVAEGIGVNASAIGVQLTDSDWTIPRAMYRDLWESINGLCSWAANPWVWVVEFKRVQPTALNLLKR